MTARTIDIDRAHPQYPGETVIDLKKCNGCGTCVKVCPGVLEMRDGRPVVIRAFSCIRCGHCASVCNRDAIAEPGAEPERITPADLKKSPSPESLQFLFRSRRSVRLYKDRPVSEKDLKKILEAGRYTATGTNSNNVRYIVLTDRKKIEELRAVSFPQVVKTMKFIGRLASSPFGNGLMGEKLAARMREIYTPLLGLFRERVDRGEDVYFYNAPALIIVYGEKHDDSAAFSCSAALYNCSLMAHTLGIGCCFMGFLQAAINTNRKIGDMLGIPKYCKCWGAMTLGYQNIRFNRLARRNPPEVKWV